MADKKKTRHRSPAYPSIDLEAAIEKAQEIYQHEARNLAHVDVILEHWGYSPGSANGTRAIAALKQFGLVDETGKSENRQIKLTERAVDILLPEDEGGDSHQQCIWDAALDPPLHYEIWEKYDGELPSDAALKRYLLLDRNFNDNTVDGFIRQFRRTLGYAGSFGESKIEGNGGGESDPTGDKPATIRAGAIVQSERTGAKQLKVTDVNDDWAFVEGEDEGGWLPMSELTAITPPKPVDEPESPRVPEWAGLRPRATQPAGPYIKMSLSGGNEFELRLRAPITKKEFDKLMKMIELNEDALVDENIIFDKSPIGELAAEIEGSHEN